MGGIFEITFELWLTGAPDPDHGAGNSTAWKIVSNPLEYGKAVPCQPYFLKSFQCGMFTPLWVEGFLLMSDEFSFSELMDRRKLTTAVAGILTDQLNSYLNTLAPLLRPRATLGNYTRGSQDKVRGADEVFQKLKETYLNVAGSRVFDLPKVLDSPIGISSALPEISPSHYSYKADVNGTAHELTITSPTKWVLSYKGLNEARLKSLLSQKLDLVSKEVAETVLHFVLIEAIISRQQGVFDLLQELGYSVEIGTNPVFDVLPVVYISHQVGTERPSDALLVQVSEVSGSPAFDELVRIEDIDDMMMPLKKRLIDQVRDHGGPAA